MPVPEPEPLDEPDPEPEIEPEPLPLAEPEPEPLAEPEPEPRLDSSDWAWFCDWVSVAISGWIALLIAALLVVETSCWS